MISRISTPNPDTAVAALAHIRPLAKPLPCMLLSSARSGRVDHDLGRRHESHREGDQVHRGACGQCSTLAPDKKTAPEPVRVGAAFPKVSDLPAPSIQALVGTMPTMRSTLLRLHGKGRIDRPYRGGYRARPEEASK